MDPKRDAMIVLRKQLRSAFAAIHLALRNAVPTAKSRGRRSSQRSVRSSVVAIESKRHSMNAVLTAKCSLSSERMLMKSFGALASNTKLKLNEKIR